MWNLHGLEEVIAVASECFFVKQIPYLSAVGKETDSRMANQLS